MRVPNILFLLLGAAPLLSAWVLPAPLHAQSASSEDQHYDIPAQPLASALVSFANRARVSIAYDEDLIAKLRSTPAKGRLSPQIALATLLQGTGLTARFTGPRSVIIFDPRSPEAAAQATVAGIATNRPTMTFDLAVVSAPRRIGRDPAAMTEYLRRAENEVQAMFAGDPAYQGSAFDMRIAITVTVNGTVESVTLLRPSGNEARDALVRELVLGRQIGAPPPEGVGRRLQFHIAGRDMQNARRKSP